MVDFGYKIQKNRQIDFDRNDRTLFHYLKQNEPSIALCIGCGSCTATCTAAQFTDFNFRKIMLNIRRGEKREVSREINQCMLCGKCILVCPKGVNTRNVVLHLLPHLFSPEP
jgi:heterodisulfide reductase subunit C